MRRADQSTGASLGLNGRRHRSRWARMTGALDRAGRSRRHSTGHGPGPRAGCRRVRSARREQESRQSRERDLHGPNVLRSEDGHLTITSSVKRPWLPRQRRTSPQVSRDALTLAVPACTAVNIAVSVPQPCPGTHPCSCGSGAGATSERRTWGFDAGPNLQYVLESTTFRWSPTCSVTVEPFERSATVVVRDRCALSAEPHPAHIATTRATAMAPWRTFTTPLRRRRGPKSSRQEHHQRRSAGMASGVSRRITPASVGEDGRGIRYQRPRTRPTDGRFRGRDRCRVLGCAGTHPPGGRASLRGGLRDTMLDWCGVVRSGCVSRMRCGADLSRSRSRRLSVRSRAARRLRRPRVLGVRIRRTRVF